MSNYNLDSVNFNKDEVTDTVMKFYKKGYSEREIIMLLSENGIKTKKGKDFSCSKIHSVIQNNKSKINDDFIGSSDIHIIAIYFDYPRGSAYDGNFLYPSESEKASIYKLREEVKNLRSYFKNENEYNENINRYNEIWKKLLYRSGFQVDTAALNKKDYFNRNIIGILFEKNINSDNNKNLFSTEELFCFKKDLLDLPEIKQSVAIWSKDKKFKLKIIREKKNLGKIRFKFEFYEDCNINEYIRYMYYLGDEEEKGNNVVNRIKKYSKDYFYILEKRKNKMVLVKKRVQGSIGRPSLDIPDYANEDKYVKQYHEKRKSKNSENRKRNWLDLIIEYYEISTDDELIKLFEDWDKLKELFYNRAEVINYIRRK